MVLETRVRRRRWNSATCFAHGSFCWPTKPLDEVDCPHAWHTPQTLSAWRGRFEHEPSWLTTSSCNTEYMVVVNLCELGVSEWLHVLVPPRLCGQAFQAE